MKNSHIYLLITTGLLVFSNICGATDIRNQKAAQPTPTAHPFEEPSSPHQSKEALPETGGTAIQSGVSSRLEAGTPQTSAEHAPSTISTSDNAVPPTPKAEKSTSSPSPLAAVVPVRGTLSGNELRALAIEVRSQLRYHGYQLARQKDVRAAISATGDKSLSASDHLKSVSKILDARIVIVPVVTGSEQSGYVIQTVLFRVDTQALSATQANLPSRGASMYTRKAIRPAAAACVASLLEKEPNPVVAPFPQTNNLAPHTILDVYGLEKEEKIEMVVTSEDIKSPDKEPKVQETKTAEVPPPNEPVIEKNDLKLEQEPEETTKYDWSKWDHKGVFADFAFSFSWCQGDALCKDSVKGFGARLRIGYRIASYVAISITGLARDHQMPITTDTQVFLNVENAFVFAGLFGGIRYHPVRRFFLDPFIGIDFGTTWFLHVGSEAVDEPITTLPSGVPTSIENYINKRRSTIYLRGFTIVPQLGLRLFLSPAIALGIHTQWTIPFFKKACVRVADITDKDIMQNQQICTEIKKIKSTPGIEPDIAETLADKDNRPTFIGLELELTFVFN